MSETQITEGFECLKKVHVTTEACIHFSELKNPIDAIGKYLSTQVLRWFAHAEGILICFSDLQILNTKGKLVDESPYVFFPISFQALVFQPKEGSHLIGKVNEIEKTYISFLVLGIFQGVIMLDELAKVKFNFFEAGWQFQRKSEVIDVGTIIQLKAKKVLRVGADSRLQIQGTFEGIKQIILIKKQFKGKQDYLAKQILNMNFYWNQTSNTPMPDFQLTAKKEAKKRAAAAAQKKTTEEQPQEQEEKQQEEQATNEVAENPESIELEL